MSEGRPCDCGGTVLQVGGAPCALCGVALRQALSDLRKGDPVVVGSNGLMREAIECAADGSQSDALTGGACCEICARGSMCVKAMALSPLIAGTLAPGETVLGQLAKAHGLVTDEQEGASAAEIEAEDSAIEHGVNLASDEDKGVALDMVEDAISLALFHLEMHAPRMSVGHAQLALAGITYLTYLGDSVGQGRDAPHSSARSIAIVRRANRIMREISQRPRIYSAMPKVN